MRHAWHLLPAILVFSTRALATDYHVSPQGDEANDCASATSTDPTKQKRYHNQGALSCLTQPGDRLILHAGTYGGELYDVPSKNGQVGLSVSGTGWGAGEFITVMGAPGEEVILESLGSFTMDLNGTNNYVLVKDLKIRNPTGGDCVVLQGSHYHLENLEIGACYGNGIIGGGSPVSTAPGSATDNLDIEFRNLYVHNVGLIPASVYPPGANGVYWGGDNLTIVGGEYSDNKCFGIRFWTSAHPPHAPPEFTADNNLVEGARIHHNGLGIGNGGKSDCGSTGGGLSIGDYASTARNNLIYANQVGIDGIYARGHGVKIYNNTLVDNGGGILLGESTVDQEMINNILFNTGTIVADPGATGTIESNNITDNPMFVNAAAFDFHLLEGSPAINAGTALASVTTDFDGVPRPQQGAYDVGAFEFGYEPPVDAGSPTDGSIVTTDGSTEAGLDGSTQSDAGTSPKAKSGSDSDGGCGCESVGSRSSSAWSFLAALALVVMRRFART